MQARCLEAGAQTEYTFTYSVHGVQTTAQYYVFSKT